MYMIYDICIYMYMWIWHHDGIEGSYSEKGINTYQSSKLINVTVTVKVWVLPKWETRWRPNKIK